MACLRLQVPHAYKPEVQMLEMSIKSFVPRGRKLRTETASCLDPGADEPTEEEHALLQKYAQPPGEMPWKPSLIAFPSFQLLPTPIYAVKHSIRTVSMLIDVLQGLQEPAFHCTSKVIPFSNSELYLLLLANWYLSFKASLQSLLFLIGYVIPLFS
jgi:Fanconi anemia group M protein